MKSSTSPFTAAFLITLASTAGAAPQSSASAGAARDASGPLPRAHWEPLAPLPGAGPRVWDIVTSQADQDLVLASTAAGLVVSHDGGATWSLQSRWPSEANGLGFAGVSSLDPDLVVVAAGVGGLWRSVDGGATWVRPTTAPPTGFYGTVLFAPQCASIVFAGGYAAGVWRSIDGGDNWHLFFENGDPVRAVDVAANDPFHVTVVTATEVHVTRDGGLSWASHPVPSGNILSMAMDSRDPERVAIGGWGDVHLSSDAGATWATLPTGQPEYIDDVHFDANVSGTIHCSLRAIGLATSVDDGATWTVNTSVGLIAAGGLTRGIHTDLEHPGRILLGDGGGLFLSSDSGSTFERRNDGLNRYAGVTGFASDPFGSGRLVVKTGGSAYFSDDEGATWTESIIPARFVSWGFEADPTTPGRYYVGDWNRGLMRSTDGGVSFQVVLDDPAMYFWNVAPHPTVAGRVFGAGPGVRRSDDGGLTFGPNLVPTNWVWDVTISPVDSDIMYCSSSSTVYRSTDGGVTFEAPTSGPTGIVRHLRADPLRAERAYASSPGSGLWRTDDSGSTWQLMTAAPESTNVSLPLGAASSGALPDGVAVGAMQTRRMFLSVDGGASFGRFGPGFGSSVSSLEHVDGQIHAGTIGSGLFRLVH